MVKTLRFALIIWAVAISTAVSWMLVREPWERETAGGNVNVLRCEEALDLRQETVSGLSSVADTDVFQLSQSSVDNELGARLTQADREIARYCD